MIYYSDQEITIRSLQPEDADTIAAEEVAQGWINASPQKYYQRLQDQKDGKAIALAADYRRQVAGYINVYFRRTGSFCQSGESRKSSILGYWKNTAAAASAVTDGCSRTNSWRIFRHGLSGSWTSQRIWKRTAPVHQTRLSSGWKRCLVQGCRL